MEKQTWSKQDIEDIIAQYNTKQGGAVGSFKVPFHRHNGSDSPKVIMGDLAYDQRGLLFPMDRGQTQMVTSGNKFYTSGNGRPIFEQARIVFDSTYTTIIDETGNYTSVVTTGPSWFLRLPNNSILPISPQVGDICMYNGFLQVCEVAGVWTQK
jgi:hypothetical protein